MIPWVGKKEIWRAKRAKRDLGEKKAFFPPLGHARLFTRLHLEACLQATGGMQIFFFSVESNIVLLFSLLRIACWNTEH